VPTVWKATMNKRTAYVRGEELGNGLHEKKGSIVLSTGPNLDKHNPVDSEKDRVRIFQDREGGHRQATGRNKAPNSAWIKGWCQVERWSRNCETKKNSYTFIISGSCFEVSGGRRVLAYQVCREVAENLVLKHETVWTERKRLSGVDPRRVLK